MAKGLIVGGILFILIGIFLLIIRKWVRPHWIYIFLRNEPKTKFEEIWLYFQIGIIILIGVAFLILAYILP